MATENELNDLAQILAGLTKPALRALCIRYGTRRIRLWSKRKDQLIDDLLEHSDHLLKGFDVETDTSDRLVCLEKGQTEIRAGQTDLKSHITAERQALEDFLGPKLDVSPRERYVNSVGSWASILGLLLALIVLIWPNTSEAYQLTIHVIREDGKPAIGATVSAPPWQPRVIRDRWLLSIPVEEVPASGSVEVTARLNEGYATETVRLAQNRQFSVTLKFRPNAFITGTVSTPSGEPLDEVQISIFGFEKDSVFSDGDGSFSVAANVPAGEEVRLTAKKGSWGRIETYVAGENYDIRLIERSVGDAAN